MDGRGGSVRREASMPILLVGTPRFQDAATNNGYPPPRPFAPESEKGIARSFPRGRFGYDACDARMEEEKPERLDRARDFPAVSDGDERRPMHRLAPTAKSGEAFSFLSGGSRERAPSSWPGAIHSGSRDFNPRGTTP